MYIKIRVIPQFGGEACDRGGFVAIQNLGIDLIIA